VDTSAVEAADTSAGAAVVSTLEVAVSTLVVAESISAEGACASVAAECISVADTCVWAVVGCVSAAYRIWAACIWVEAISEAFAAAAAARVWVDFRRADCRGARALREPGV
jgi:hypothetical protein